MRGKYWAGGPYDIKSEIINATEHPLATSSYLEVEVKNAAGDIEKHFLYVQNGILNILRPTGKGWNDANAKIQKNMDILLYSLRAEIVK